MLPIRIRTAVLRSLWYQRRRYDLPHLLQSTTKILPELSNLLPFLSAWGALMLSEGAGLPEWLVVRGGLHQAAQQAACHAAVQLVSHICLHASRLLQLMLLAALPAVTSSTNKQFVHMPAEPA